MTFDAPQAAALRAKNRKTVETYLADTKGQNRLRRHRLFAPNAVSGLWTTETCEPIVIEGIEALERHAHWSLQCFPDWEWVNIRIFTTDDPNFVWAECDGRGRICFPGYREGHYENHFLHSFELANGLIVRNREFMNPIAQLKALEIDVPRIRREGLAA